MRLLDRRTAPVSTAIDMGIRRSGLDNYLILCYR
jgi:hypothetical protein